MSCVNCSNAVTRVVSKIEGVKSANVNYASSSGEFEIDDESIIGTITQKIEKLGYKVVDNYDELEAKKKEGLRVMFIKLIVSLFLASAIMIIEMSSVFSFYFKFIASAILTTIVIVYCGSGFFYHAYSSLRNRNFDMNVLISMGSSLAFLYSVFVVLYSKFSGVGDEFVNLYFSSASMIITFVLFGKYLEERSKIKANDYIKSLIDLSPKTALLVADEIKEIEAKFLKPGDIVLVKQGMGIPCDGVITKGGGDIDTSLITGESLAVYKSVGDEVNAGCINVGGILYVRVTKFWNDSLLSQIKDLINKAIDTKMPISRLADKISNIFVPSVILIAIFIFAGWSVAGKPFVGMLCAVCVLIISCPCAIGLATPIAIICAISNAAKSGVLVRNPEVLEILKDVGVVVFDKTGTLSKSKISVYKTTLNDDDLGVLAGVEELVDHPISRAIVDFAKGRNLSFDKFEGKIENIIGRGVRAGNLLIGNRALFDENGVEIVENSQIKELLDSGFGVVFVAIEGKFRGFVALSDEMREEAGRVINTLKNDGIRVVMLTGDNEKTANFVAKNLGIDEVVAGVLPSEKYEFIEKIKGKNRVLFVGDGVNDAPSLKVADIGVAMNSGSDIAKGVGDIVFVGNNLENLPYLIRLSKKTMNTIKQNLFWAFFYNAICIPVAAGVFYPAFILKPMFAAFAMCFSSISVVLNSIRLKISRI